MRVKCFNLHSIFTEKSQTTTGMFFKNTIKEK